MMQQDEERKQELKSAVTKYLCQAERYPLKESGKKQGDSEASAHLLYSIEAEKDLMKTVDCLFDSQVSLTTVRIALGMASYIVDQISPFKFPFEDDELEQKYHDEIYKLLNFHFKRPYDAIVPMYQLECESDVEFPLANAVLYSGGEDSRLAATAKDNENHLQNVDRQQIEQCSYLKFRVTGDRHSCLAQVESKVQQALQVLRFIYPWSEKDGKAYNSAHGVSMWKHSNRVIVYDPITTTNYLDSWYADIPKGIWHPISAEFLRDARIFYGLDDINCHFKHSASNPVSKRICRALSFYDTAAQASDIHVAFSGFIISVDILLRSKKGERAKHLKSLIEYSKGYLGEMTLNEELGESTPWPERVRLTTIPFEKFYTTRSQILHGNDEEKYSISASIDVPIPKSEAKKARQIAHNAIRAYAYLARAFEWTAEEKAKDWFKAPRKPPEVKTP